MAAQRFTAEDLSMLARPWDDAVRETPDIDGFCSSTAWSFAAAESFPEAGPPTILGDGRAFCGLRSAAGADGQRVLLGLDPVWGFASPLVGPPAAAATMLAARLELEPFDHAVVTGQRTDSLLAAWIVRTLEDRFRLLHGPVQERLRIDLAGGVEGWLARRSPRFRQRARRLQRAGDGVCFVDVSALPPDELIDRLIDVEHRSWKGRQGTGLASSGLAAFYRQVAARLAAREQLRALIARRGDTDVGYILGGVRGPLYRGLQLSYTEDVRDLAVGHRLQLAQLGRLEVEGIETYDLGMDMEYKRRWADRVDETFAIVVTR